MSFDFNKAKADYEAKYKNLSKRAAVDDAVDNALLDCLDEVLKIAKHCPDPNLRFKASTYVLDRGHFNKPETEKALDKFMASITDDVTGHDA